MHTMIKGTGIDLVSIDRLRDQSRRFVERVLSDEELAIYDTITDTTRKLTFLAGRFAAKEAYVKAKDKSQDVPRFKDVTILPDADGKPQWCLPRHDNEYVHVSITHTDAYAIAMVVIERIKE